MSILEKLFGSILFSVMFAAGASAGEPGAGAAKAYQAGGGGPIKEDRRGSPLPTTFGAGKGGAFKAADSSNPSAPKGGEPAGALPARVVGGETFQFDPAKEAPGAAKVRDPVGSLPTAVGSGEGAAYAQVEEAEPSASKAVQSDGPVGVSEP